MAFGKVLYGVICVYLNSGGGWDFEKKRSHSVWMEMFTERTEGVVGRTL